MRTVLVTGGGRGLGRVTAGKLARDGHRVVLVARTRQAAQAAAAQILAADPAAEVEPRWADLSRPSAIRDLAPAIVADVGTLDVLLNIAGVMQTSPVRRVTAGGFEETLAVNALAPFLLTALMLPALERSDSARVVNVSSRLHLPGSRGRPVDFDFDDPQLEHGYNPDRAYKNSKLAVMWFTYELQRRLRPRTITVNAVCPGFVPATAAASTACGTRWLLTHVLPHMLFATSIDTATDSSIFMAMDPSLDGVGGRFYADRHQIESSAESSDPDKARRFWALASSLTRLDPDWPAASQARPRPGRQ